MLVGIHGNTSSYPESLQSLTALQCLLQLQGGDLSAVRRGDFKALTDLARLFTWHKTRARISSSAFRQPTPPTRSEIAVF